MYTFSNQATYNTISKDRMNTAVSHSNKDPSSEMAAKCEQLKQLFLSKVDVSFIKQYSHLLHQRIQMAEEDLQKEAPVQTKGRGGNNISQNIKKCLITLLKKHLQGHIFKQFEQECILAHSIKSQKESVIILFLYLHKFRQEGLVTQSEIEDIRSNMNRKILKYIANSRMKMEVEGRNDFHMKNIEQFEKYLGFDLNFDRQRTFAQLQDMTKGLYRKKKSQYEKATNRIRHVIHKEPYFTALFAPPPPPPPPIAMQQECDLYFNNEQ